MLLSRSSVSAADKPISIARELEVLAIAVITFLMTHQPGS